VPQREHSNPGVAASSVSMDPKLPVVNGPGATSQTPPVEIETGAVVVEMHNQEQAPRAGTLHRWMHRSSIFLFVLLSATAGVLLVILPWTPEWTDNYLLLSFPWLRAFFSSGFFRGLCSGLGLLDIWIGFWEAFHYHERN
jgi:hypothetical protein